MSIAVYRKRIQSSDNTWRDFNITAQTLREIAAYGRSISGLLINNDALPYNVYSSLNFSGGDMEECVFKWSTDSQSAYVLFGAVKDGHTVYTEPDTYTRLSEYSHTGSGGNYAWNDLYLIVKDGQLIGMNCHNAFNGSDWYRDSGFILFYYDDDGLRVAFEGGVGSSYVSPTCGDLKAFDDTNNRSSGSIILAGEYELSGRIPYRILNITATGYKTKAGKALIYPVYCNDVANRIDKHLEYPVGIKCDDLSISGAYNIAPSYQKIQIEGQKYIHIGDQFWMPYDTYTETTINV